MLTVVSPATMQWAHQQLAEWVYLGVCYVHEAVCDMLAWVSGQAGTVVLALTRPLERLNL
jgi:hypothetical protein